MFTCLTMSGCEVERRRKKRRTKRFTLTFALSLEGDFDAGLRFPDAVLGDNHQVVRGRRPEILDLNRSFRRGNCHVVRRTSMRPSGSWKFEIRSGTRGKVLKKFFRLLSKQTLSDLDENALKPLIASYMNGLHTDSQLLTFVEMRLCKYSRAVSRIWIRYWVMRLFPLNGGSHVTLTCRDAASVILTALGGSGGSTGE